jgi:hypothetical protein
MKEHPAYFAAFAIVLWFGLWGLLLWKAMNV